jgi:hypothetical protein
MEDEKLYVVTEQGMYGEMEINDPSKKRVLSKKELDKMIEEANQQNLENLTK